VKKSLRYSKILFMTDQDLDGSHIKGLGINMFESQWRSLLKLNLVGFMNTPIIKARKGTQEKLFYNDAEYDHWKETDPKGWSIKYYKLTRRDGRSNITKDWARALARNSRSIFNTRNS
jgi:DNA topoisomerase-2